MLGECDGIIEVAGLSLRLGFRAEDQRCETRGLGSGCRRGRLEPQRDATRRIGQVARVNAQLIGPGSARRETCRKWPAAFPVRGKLGEALILGIEKLDHGLDVLSLLVDGGAPT